MKSLDSILESGSMQQGSVLGLFLRRMSLSFRKLEFRDIYGLMERLENYLGTAQETQEQIDLESTSRSVSVSSVHSESMDMSMNKEPLEDAKTSKAELIPSNERLTDQIPDVT